VLPKEGNSYEILFLRKIKEKNKKQKNEIAWKLHKQFSHPSGKKMVNLAKSANIKDKEFLKMLEDLPDSCEICQRYKKASPRPVVGLSLATKFNETVAMDIKEILGHKVLHMIDHGTRYSVAARISNKESKTIIETIFRYWISYFGSPKNLLTDNGREFNNESFRDMAQNMNIIVHTTAAESPWSNGLNERHNAILGEMVKKTKEDAGCSMDQAIGWAVCAKNALANVNGYSPNQLVFGWNINIPTCLNSQAPALEGVSTSEIVAKNLNAIHTARKSFIENESAEKLRRAFRHQIRPDIGYNYHNGDMVLYKRMENDRWIGPGTVIGAEKKQVLVKHGGTYVRVHPTRLRLYNSSVEENHKKEQNEQMENVRDTEKSENKNKEIKLDCVFDSREEDSDNEEQPEVVVTRKKEIVIPKKGDNIDVKTLEKQDLWRKCYVLGKAGKTTGKNKYFMNVRFEEGDYCLDFENKVVDWKKQDLDSSDEQQSSFAEILLENSTSAEIQDAMEKELCSWVNNKVYSEVKDVGQSRVSTRWVLKRKHSNGKSFVKARLVARGFEDEEASQIRTDSPTCSKEGLRIALMIIQANHWVCNSLDFKTAFLQSNPFSRDVYISPPIEAKIPEGTIWKLSKSIYGLNDAPRSWYTSIREELLNLGAEPSKYDEALYTWYVDGKLHGIISTHVDDFCWGGTKLFGVSVMDIIRKKYKIGSEKKDNFRYLGLDVTQRYNSIKLDQKAYLDSIELIPDANLYTRNSEDIMNEKQLTLARSAIGKLNWLATQTRPDLCYDL
jgi:transposase InsO family protein